MAKNEKRKMAKFAVGIKSLFALLDEWTGQWIKLNGPCAENGDSSGRMGERRRKSQLTFWWLDDWFMAACWSDQRVCASRGTSLNFPRGSTSTRSSSSFLRTSFLAFFLFIFCVLFGFSEDAAGADASLLVSLVLRRRTRLRKMRSVPLVFSFSGPVCDSFFYIFLFIS